VPRLRARRARKPLARLPRGQRMEHVLSALLRRLVVGLLEDAAARVRAPRALEAIVAAAEALVAHGGRGAQVSLAARLHRARGPLAQMGQTGIAAGFGSRTLQTCAYKVEKVCFKN
jgi:hypothetical protein